MSGTRHSPMVTRERLPCSTHVFHVSLRLLNLITRGGTPQPLGSYALYQGLIVFLSIYLWLKHEIFTVTPMSSRTWGRIGPFRVITQQYASSFESQQIEDTRANVFLAGCPNKHPVFCSLLQRLHDDHPFSTDPFGALAEIKVLLENPRGSRFVVLWPHANATASCGSGRNSGDPRAVHHLGVKHLSQDIILGTNSPHLFTSAPMAKPPNTGAHSF